MEQNILQNKKIAVVGVGGVGGYIAGMLGKTFPHLTLAARGARKDALLKEGLILHSEYNGEITVRPERVTETKDIGKQDYIFICVKNYSLDEVCRDIEAYADENTVVVPIMNGVDKGERVKKLLPKAHVIDSLIYIVAFSNPDFSITQQGKFANIVIGSLTGEKDEKVDELGVIMKFADIDCAPSDDIVLEVWRKYILNCAYNVATAYYNNTIGELRSDPQKAKEYEALVNEAGAVALAKGVNIKPEHLEYIIYRFYYEHQDGATSSLQRDIWSGKQAELDTFGSYLVKEAKKLGIDVPVSEKMYEGLVKISKNN